MNSRQPSSGHTAGSEAYRSQAGRYDRPTDAFRRWRELVVEQLPARPGDTVLDVGCGTGLCLPLLQHRVGPSGTIVGIDASAQMLDRARARVATRAAWDPSRPPDTTRSPPSNRSPCNSMANCSRSSTAVRIDIAPAALATLG
jgi:Methyltransferase domain